VRRSKQALNNNTKEPSAQKGKVGGVHVKKKGMGEGVLALREKPIATLETGFSREVTK
jgi:hypothetical protein